MGHDTVLARVAENGRLSIPARQRKLLGLEKGGVVVIQEKDGELRIRSVRDVVADLQAQVRQYFPKSDVSPVDELIAERRAEAEREAREMEERGP